MTSTQLVIMGGVVSMLDQRDKCDVDRSENEPDHNTMTQVSTVGALLSSVYDGDVALQSLLTHGDFGIGTFDHLDGEMIVLDGCVYQVKHDGTVVRPDLALTTPFAVVTNFEADELHPIQPRTSLDWFERDEEECLPTKNIFHAIRINGAFSSMTCRSIPRQTKPYPSLPDVAQQESVFELGEVEGTVVGFRCPQYAAGINLPGYHFHFISSDRSSGGHVLDFMIEFGDVAVDYLPNFSMMLPQSEAFYCSDLSKKTSVKDLNEIEREVPHDAHVVTHR